jgi:hypothetical protein
MTEERWQCWYCDLDFETVTDAWSHMDLEHPKEASEDLARMDADLIKRTKNNDDRSAS